MWQPVLDGELAREARDAARAIVDALDVVAIERHSPSDVALLWAYAAGAFDDERSSTRFDDAVSEVVEQIRNVHSTRLYGGLAGIGWLLAHVTEEGGELLDAIDRKLVAELDAWTGHYDLIGGLVGVGTYFLERGSAPTARDGLGRVVDRLLDWRESGDTWHTRPDLLPPWQREKFPDGVHDCGVAHGAPGAIAFLAKVAALPNPPRDVAAACTRAIAWLTAQALPPTPEGRFPSMVAAGSQPMVARFAWCYGDLGIAAALWSATARMGGDVAPWIEVARACALRDVDTCHVRDAGICHGAFGAAHIMNRFFQASRDDVFRTAARVWIERGLAMRRAGEGVGGFRTATPDSPIENPTYVASDAFLEGAGGIGLVLLAAIASEEPTWDRLLLCDVPASTD